MMSKLIHGCRIAVLVGVVSMGIASIIGILVGAIAGYFGDNRLKIKRIAYFTIPFVVLLLFALFLWLPTFYHQNLNPDRFSSLAELPSGLANLLRIVLIVYTFFIVFLDSQYLVLAARMEGRSSYSVHIPAIQTLLYR